MNWSRLFTSSLVNAEWMNTRIETMDGLRNHQAEQSGPSEPCRVMFTPEDMGIARPNETVEIRWSMTGGKWPIVALSCSRDSGEHYFFSTSVPNTGAYNWTVPVDADFEEYSVFSQNCYVASANENGERTSGASNGCYNYGTLMLSRDEEGPNSTTTTSGHEYNYGPSEPCRLEFTPEDMGTAQINETVVLRWNMTGGIWPMVYLSCNRDRGEHYFFTTSVPNTDIFNWTVPLHADFEKNASFNQNCYVASANQYGARTETTNNGCYNYGTLMLSRASSSDDEGPNSTPAILPTTLPLLSPSALPLASPSAFPSAMSSILPSKPPSGSPSVFLPPTSPSASPSESLPSASPSSLPSASPSPLPITTNTRISNTAMRQDNISAATQGENYHGALPLLFVAFLLIMAA